eukprot:749731-Hanusia_phi.AAC.3
MEASVGSRTRGEGEETWEEGRGRRGLRLGAELEVASRRLRSIAVTTGAYLDALHLEMNLQHFAQSAEEED